MPVKFMTSAEVTAKNKTQHATMACSMTSGTQTPVMSQSLAASEDPTLDRAQRPLPFGVHANTAAKKGKSYQTATLGMYHLDLI